LDEGLHPCNVGKPPEVASPLYKLPINHYFMTLNDFKRLNSIFWNKC
jgi:hypothetical protein